MKLKTEQNTPSMERRVRSAAREILHASGREIETVYEHGQWWVIRGGMMYSVVDAEGGDSIDGFDLEEV